MKIIYNNNKTERLCEDTKRAVKELGNDVAMKLSSLITLLKSANNLHDLSIAPQFRLHALKGNRIHQYSFVIHKGSKWRLIVYPLDQNDCVLTDNSNETAMLQNAVAVKIMEVSEHYE